MDIKSLFQKINLKKKGVKVTIVLVVLAALLGGGSKYWFGNDNIAEQAAEKFIEENTGLQIDLSPWE